jgi:hypothetical protein
VSDADKTIYDPVDDVYHFSGPKVGYWVVAGKAVRAIKKSLSKAATDFMGHPVVGIALSKDGVEIKKRPAER